MQETCACGQAAKYRMFAIATEKFAENPEVPMCAECARKAFETGAYESDGTYPKESE